MREIILDTETTGVSPQDGDRIIEIGCVELVNRIIKREFQLYLNPEGREVNPEALKVHGITNEFLQNKPRFSDIADKFLEFIGDDKLVMHNASFDLAFLNMELKRIDRPPISMDRVVDTLALARRKHPSAQNSLDALCKRYCVNNSDRTKHGALLDATLLANVYIEMLDERQAALRFDQEGTTQAATRRTYAAKQRPVPLPPRLTQEDAELHLAFIETLGEKAIWRRHSTIVNPV